MKYAAQETIYKKNGLGNARSIVVGTSITTSRDPPYLSLFFHREYILLHINEWVWVRCISHAALFPHAVSAAESSIQDSRAPVRPECGGVDKWWRGFISLIM